MGQIWMVYGWHLSGKEVDLKCGRGGYFITCYDIYDYVKSKAQHEEMLRADTLMDQESYSFIPKNYH